MRSGIPSGAVVVLAIACAGAGCGQEIASRTTTLALPEGHAVTALATGDVDGDGLEDLVIAARSGGESPSRTLRVHRRRKEGVPYAAAPDFEVPLTSDVVGFLLAGLRPGAGQALLVFNRRALFRLPWPTEEERRPEKLLDADFLWQNPGPGRLVSWTAGRRDLDGDGLDDLLVPEPGGWRVAFQERDGEGRARFARQVLLEIPRTAADDKTTPRGAYGLEGRRARKRLQTRVSLGSSIEVEQSAAPLLAVTEALPAVIPTDWDADGDLDLVLRTTERVHVWIQEPRGRFAPAPGVSLPSPVVADQERRLDVSYSAHLADLDGDRRADCVLVAGDRRSEDVKTQVLLYLQGGRGAGEKLPLFGERGIPDQLVPLAGFAARPQLEDVNRDGLPDLALAVFRPDLLDELGSKSGKTFDLGWFVFFNRKGTVSPQADLQVTIRVASADLDSARSFLTLGFIDDVSGDGYPDLLVQSSPRSVRLLAPRPRGRGRLELTGDAAWKLGWEAEGEVQVVPSGPGGRPELLIETGSAVLHVEFTR